MMKKTLMPDFSMSEPNMESAQRKNKECVCAMHECDNKLSDPPAYGFGFKICNECGKRLDRVRDDIVREMIDEADEYIIGRLTNYFNRNKND